MPDTRLPFAAGSFVLVTLSTPREKYFGILISIDVAGVTICGIDLNSLEDFARLARTGEAIPSHVFFPMHRVEKIELDTPTAGLPSLCEHFSSAAGRDATQVFQSM